MAAFVLPELFARTSVNGILTANVLTKYNHLLKWNEKPSILEIGYGDGSNSKQALWPIIPKNYQEFVATDISKKMLNYAQQMDVLPRTKFQELDIGCKEVPSNFHSRFDHIFSFYTLMYAITPEQAFKNVYKMLKPEGHTFHIFPSEGPADAAYLNLSKHPHWKKYNQQIMLSAYYDKVNKEEYFEKALKDGGFQKYNFVIEDMVREFPNENSWKDWFLSINSSLSRIPLEEREEYKNDLFYEINKLLSFDAVSTVRRFNFRLCIISATKLD